MTLAIRQLERHENLTPEVIDTFIENHDFPIVEDTSVTFVFRGKVDEVKLKHWVYGLESSLDLVRLKTTDLWYLVLELPDRSRIEYKYDIVVDGYHRWVHDPFNPLVARDSFGINSVCCTAGYHTPEWIFEDRETRLGSIEEYVLHNTVFGAERTIYVYLPPL